MLETRLFSNLSSGEFCGTDRRVNWHADLLNSAIQLFHRARRQSLWLRLKARLLGQSTQLLSLSEFKGQLHIHGSRYSGVQTVPLARIIGSEQRAGDFDSAFHPLQAHLRDRWVSVAIAYRQYITLPPIQVIQIGAHYFVRDGHHRVSVALALGQIDIEGEVIVWETAAPLPWEVTCCTPQLVTQAA
jgi:hypothetical protein